MRIAHVLIAATAAVLPSGLYAHSDSQKDRWAQLDAHFEAEAQRGERAGYVILVASDDRILHHTAVGFADVESRRPMRVDDKFRLASMTKPITSVAAIMLFERGDLLLSDPVERYLPEFKNAKVVEGTAEDGSLRLVPTERPMTILDLMLHTSGIGGRSPDVNPQAAKLYADLLPSYFGQGSLEDKVKLLAQAPLWYQPGKEWGYGIYSTDVLGRVVEVVSGLPLDQFVQREILDPLGMKSTGFLKAGQVVPDLASIYTHDEQGKLVKVANHPLDNLTAPHGGGGMYSTAADYLKFLRFVEASRQAPGPGLISPSSVELMTRNGLPGTLLPIGLGIPLPAGGFAPGGYGVATPEAPMPHSPFAMKDYFWAGSTDPYFFVSPDRDVIGVIMTQIQPNPKVSAWRTWDEFTTLALAAATAEPRERKPH